MSPEADLPDAVAAGMSEIATEVRTCQLCPLSRTRTHAVPGTGNVHSVVLFVGEGPGFDEDQQGKPFVGRSGQYLTETLKQVGVQRDDVFITNVVKCRPPGNRDPEPGEIAACSDYLTRQITLISPRIIVTLGRYSMGRWLPGASITRVHGQVKNIGHGRVVLPMYHPAAALRNPAWKVEFERDMQALPRLIERAVRADEAAARGEALPAGVPHPGDADYHVADASRKDVQDKQGEAGDAGSAAPGVSPTKNAGEDDDLRQLALF